VKQTEFAEQTQVASQPETAKEASSVARNAGDKAKDINIKFTAIKADEIWKEFEAFIGRFKDIIDVLKKSKLPLMVRITKSMTERQMLHAVILSYGVLSLLRSIIGKEATGSHAVNLAFDHWDLGRKLRQLYTQFGASEAEAWRITDLVKAALSRTNVPHGSSLRFGKDSAKFSASEFAALIIEENYLNEDFRRILGINFYNDIPWFNKEGFEDALYYGSLFFMIDGSADLPIEERIERITGVYDVLVKAEAKSEYRFDTLLDILTDKPRTVSAKKKGK
jgi:hypothetical protein